MAKHPRKWNKTSYERRIKNGRGNGEGYIYQPWICVQDFSSQGTISRVLGWKTNRTHHLMSNNELYYFFLLDWDDTVTDIREQFPMNVSQTIDIAIYSGIKHPCDAKSGFPFVMTSDFMITTTQGLIVRTIKMSQELENKRVLEKLEIERRYWKEKGIDWRLVTEREINVQKAKNVEWLHSSKKLQGIPYEAETIRSILETITMLYHETDDSILNICRHVDSIYAVESGTGLSLFKHLASNKQLTFDMTERLNLTERRGNQTYLQTQGKKAAI